ncbi:MAG TPA: Maf family nucleotide pyrophosphatase [Candidatus Limnocylindria bacterium]|nr:Maf family nucleotide pyrophosphatase [Candidatus Limnocylindria bacterium]
MKRQIILASTSPRRKDLMGLLKIKFKAVDSGYEEVMHQHLEHNQLVKFLALGKAKAAAKKYPKAIIIAADTIVSYKGKAIGKPKTKEQAVDMLKNFSAKPHLVISGTVVMDAASKRVFISSDSTKIYFKKLSKADISKYIASGEAMDKAGGYGFLGKGFNLIEKIEGDLTVDLGMSLGFVFNSLAKLGIEV